MDLNNAVGLGLRHGLGWNMDAWVDLGSKLDWSACTGLSLAVWA